jgi:hypothetical protein
MAEINIVAALFELFLHPHYRKMLGIKIFSDVRIFSLLPCPQNMQFFGIKFPQDVDNAKEM